jgi:hypothetical protein
VSRENVELVKALHPTGVDLVELFGGPDSSDLWADPGPFSDDLEVQWISSQLSEQQQVEYQGLDGFLEGWRDWLAPWASYRMDVVDVLDAGDDVVAFVRVKCRTARDDVAVEHAPASVWTLRDGKVTRIRFYLDRETALEAAGLRE